MPGFPSYPASPPGDFNSLGFAPGQVRGARTWRVRDDGVLEGPVYRQAFLPGENLAVCRVPSNGVVQEDGSKLFTYPTRGHLPGCRCGFYGYYDGSNDYYRPDHRSKWGRNYVAGMIEGYGEVLIGSRGFRVTKARIVAIHFPDTFVDPRLVLAQYPDVPVFATFEQMESAYPCEGKPEPEPLKQIEA